MQQVAKQKNALHSDAKKNMKQKFKNKIAVINHLDQS